MWSSSCSTLLSKYMCLLLLLISYLTPPHISTAEAHQIQSDFGFDWASSSSSAMLSMIGSSDLDEILDDQEDQDGSSGGTATDGGRRSLYWKKRYYISYGALSANRVPCPPRSGRSYYTHNCFTARAPANPYHRGCSCISRCRR